jgi:FkbM family methyltransferase
VLLKPFVYEPARHLYKLLRDPAYRSWCALDAAVGSAPRHQERTARMHGWNLRMPDAASFLSAYKEIFVNRAYAFHSKTPAPRILDFGANVGVGVLFLKMLYPGARITAYEPDPVIFEYLVHNVHGNGFGDVELVNKAVWKESGSLTFRADGADGGRIAGSADTGTIPIESVDVRSVLAGETLDFVKIDIEGAETAVVRAAADKLQDVRNIFVEYHSDPSREQELAELLGILTVAGFRLDVQSPFFHPSPMMGERTVTGFDLQLNIFGWREER